MRHYPPRTRPLAPLLAVLLLLGVGCAGQRVTPARQLQSGDLVVSGSVDTPGMFFLPRVSGQALYGIGPGDVGVHAGTTVLTYNAGVTGRAYLGKSLILSAQGDYNRVSLLQSETLIGGLITATGRLTNAVRAGRFLYGGPQLSVVAFQDSDQLGFAGVNVGGVIGVDFLPRSNLGIQAELSLSPISLGPEAQLSFFPASLIESESSNFLSPLSAIQLSANFYLRSTRASRQKLISPSAPEPSAPPPSAPTPSPAAPSPPPRPQEPPPPPPPGLRDQDEGDADRPSAPREEDEEPQPSTPATPAPEAPREGEPSAPVPPPPL